MGEREFVIEENWLSELAEGREENKLVNVEEPKAQNGEDQEIILEKIGVIVKGLSMGNLKTWEKQASCVFKREF